MALRYEVIFERDENASTERYGGIYGFPDFDNARIDVVGAEVYVHVPIQYLADKGSARGFCGEGTIHMYSPDCREFIGAISLPMSRDEVTKLCAKLYKKVVCKHG